MRVSSWSAWTVSVSAMRDDGPALRSLDGDVGPAGANVEREVAVDVGDVEEPLEEVGGDVAFLLELLDGGRGALRDSVSTGAESGVLVM